MMNGIQYLINIVFFLAKRDFKCFCFFFGDFRDLLELNRGDFQDENKPLEKYKFVVDI